MIKEFKRIPIKWTIAGVVIAVVFGVIALTNAISKTSNTDLTEPNQKVNNSTVVDYEKQSDAATKFVNDKGYEVVMNGVGSAYILLPNSFEEQKDGVNIGELLSKYNQLSKQNGLDFSGYLGKKVYFFAIGLEKDNKFLDQQMILMLDGSKIVGYWMDKYDDGDEINSIPNLLTIR
ncbi:MAG TPA: DUF4830 domain-containing protein [Desulfitobacteriaceae bacterium]|jgi:hypothetical protein|nr:DUF4830 domain-containing protein [Desulfitobacteriaceae bacterium]